MTAQKANRKMTEAETAESRRRKGICPLCLHFVGRGNLLTVCDCWMCAACGQRAIDLWNAMVRDAERRVG